MKSYIKIIAMLIVISLFFYSCSDDDSSVVDSGGKTTIKGRVTSSPTYGKSANQITSGVEGAVVTTAEISANGAFNVTSDEQVTTDVNGNFEITTSLAGKTNIVVMAVKGSQEWKAVVSSEIQQDVVNECQPLNMETTSEAEVYARIVADGKANMVQYSDVAFQINGQLALDIMNSNQVEAEVKQAIETEAEARVQTYENVHYGYTNAEVQSASSIEASAQEKYESDLYLSNDSEVSYQQALDAYINATVNGYNQSSISLTDYAEVREVSSKSMLSLSENFTSETKFQIFKRNAYLKAKLMSEATLNLSTKADVNAEEKQNIEQANSTLYLAVHNSATMEDINTAFVNYRNSVKASFKASFDSLSVALTSVENAIESGIKSSLETSVNSATTINGIINAYAAFDASINTSVNTNLDMMNDNSKLEAFAGLYTLIYMSN